MCIIINHNGVNMKLNNLLIIGDIHGKLDKYQKIINNHKGNSIQVGDFGFEKHHRWHLDNIDSSKHKVNFGNHDDYTFLLSKHSLHNSSYINKNGEEIMTVRGAYSIDKDYRIPGVSWWANEELNYNEMKLIIDSYIKKKPKIMITHDCPQIIRNYFFGITDKSITSNGLQTMFEEHQPDLWVFGHHHRSKNEIINGTHFICLAELETMII